MIWLILGAALLAVVATVAVIRLRHAQRTLNAILAEHHERMDNPNGTAHDGDADHRAPPSHRRHGRRGGVRANGGYDQHRRMSA
jgi:hypothetical protein